MADGIPGDGLDDDVDAPSAPDGYTLIDSRLLQMLCALARPTHVISELFEEVRRTLRAGQPHPAAMVQERESTLQLVDGRGQQKRGEIQWVGVAIAVAPIQDLHKLYSELTHEPEFRQLLEGFELVEPAKEPVDG